MTSASSTSASTSANSGQPPRIVLKSAGPATGLVDGVWWPASRDFAAELPTVVAELAPQLGALESVSYHLGAWPATPRKINVDGAVVRMSGFRTQHHDTVDLIGARHRLVILVVPPETDPEIAREVMAAAGRDGNTDDIHTLLTNHRDPELVVAGTD